MKQEKLTATKVAKAPTDVRDTIHRRSGADRYTGITATQGASAAAKNVLSCNIGSRGITAMAVHCVRAVHGERPAPLPRPILTVQEKTWRAYFKGEIYQPRRTLKEDEKKNEDGHSSYIEDLLSPSKNAHLLEVQYNAWPGQLPVDHAKALDNLRTRSCQANDKIYYMVIRGDLARALIAVGDGKLSAHDPKCIQDVIRNHARCFAIRTAHAKIAFIRQHSVAPFGDRFSGFNQWANVGHTIMATIAAPAMVIQKLVRAGAAGIFTDTAEDQLLEELVEHDLLPGDNCGEQIFADAKAVRGTLARHPRGLSHYKFDRVLDFLDRGTARAATLNRGDMKDEGLSKMDFAEFQIGLSAAEASAFVAFQLLRTFDHIDACIAAIVDGRALPPCRALPPNKKQIAFNAVLLRSEGLPDKNATKVDGSSTTGSDGLDKERGSGRIPTASMLKKIADPWIAQQAEKHLGFNARSWFS